MWARIVSMLLGIWLMASPDLFAFSNVTADNDHIAGPLIVTFSIVAMSGCTRHVRLLNLPVGIWLLLAPWILGYGNNMALTNDLATGGFVILLSLVRQKVTNRYGGGWMALFRVPGTGTR